MSLAELMFFLIKKFKFIFIIVDFIIAYITDIFLVLIVFIPPLIAPVLTLLSFSIVATLIAAFISKRMRSNKYQLYYAKDQDLNSLTEINNASGVTETNKTLTNFIKTEIRYQVVKKKPPKNMCINAQQGNADAQYALGLMYAEGNGVEENNAEAVKWFRMAAKQGNADAQYALGVMYAKGNGVEEDNVEAVKWFRVAAKQGDVRAQYTLGLMYAEGNGVKRDNAEAVKWFRMAAKQGDERAQYTLGLMYAEGNGVERDNAEAVKWFRMAAEQGDAISQGNLGLMYAEGNGVERDNAEAVKWFRMAAEQGFTIALYDLGVMYDKSEGVPRDVVMAYMWYSLAAVNGDKDAKTALDTIERYMTSEQIAEAQKRISE